MKVFEKSESTYDSKVNFVDKNNVFVGYDLSQSCCENADWFISKQIRTSVYGNDHETYKEEEFDTEPYVFDTEFFKRIDESNELDAGSMVTFKLINEDTKEERYLHLFNCHNGYYGHGFEFKINDEVIKMEFL